MNGQRVASLEAAAADFADAGLLSAVDPHVSAQSSKTLSTNFTRKSPFFHLPSLILPLLEGFCTHVLVWGFLLHRTSDSPVPHGQLLVGSRSSVSIMRTVWIFFLVILLQMQLLFFIQADAHFLLFIFNLGTFFFFLLHITVLLLVTDFHLWLTETTKNTQTKVWDKYSNKKHRQRQKMREPGLKVQLEASSCHFSALHCPLLINCPRGVVYKMNKTGPRTEP